MKNCKPGKQQTVNHCRLGSAPEGGGWGRARRRLWAATGRGLTDASKGQRAEHEVHDDIIARDTAAGCPLDHPLDELRGRAEALGQRWPAQDTCPPRGQTSRASTVQVSSQLHIESSGEAIQRRLNTRQTSAGPLSPQPGPLIRDHSGSTPGLKNC